MTVLANQLVNTLIKINLICISIYKEYLIRLNYIVFQEQPAAAFPRYLKYLNHVIVNELVFSLYY